MAKKKQETKNKGKVKLTNRQEQFCREYIIDLNAARAARASGYKYPNVAGTQNLAKRSIKDRIDELKKQSINRVRSIDELELSADAVLAEMKRVAFFRPEDFATVDEKTGAVKYLITKDNLHLLAGITGLKIRECPPITVVEAGVEIQREVLEVDFKTDKTRALESLMKHFGILKEKVEVAGMNELITALQKGRERVANMKKEEK